MPPIFAKLNLTTQSEVLVLDAPTSFEAELELLNGVEVVRSIDGVETVAFALAFVVEQIALDAVSKALVAKAAEDPLLWFAYPKKSSKKYHCDFDRDSGWDALRAAGYDSVRIVAIDADWCALRFRKIAYIKSSTRVRR